MSYCPDCGSRFQYDRSPGNCRNVWHDTTRMSETPNTAAGDTPEQVAEETRSQIYALWARLRNEFGTASAQKFVGEWITKAIRDYSASQTKTNYQAGRKSAGYMPVHGMKLS